jgi:hypothetical protein
LVRVRGSATLRFSTTPVTGHSISSQLLGTMSTPGGKRVGEKV